VASSNAEYQNHINLGLPFKKMVTVWEGVDVTEFTPSLDGDEVREEFRIPSGTHIVGSISRIDEGKGHECLLRAAHLVVKEQPETVFLIVGDGDESIKAEMIQLAQTLGIKDSVIFAGWRTDVAKILNALDVFVHCPDTWLEGMGIATLEAIACGKPVVITENWGLVDTTADGHNGFIVPIGDHCRLADKIILLLEDGELRRQMGENARARAVQEFDIRKNVRSIEKIMLDTLKGTNLDYA
jgi:glycosyltransferase involved in cell wall biosynthesis